MPNVARKTRLDSTRPPDIKEIVRSGAAVRIVHEFAHENFSVRVLVKRWRLTAPGIEQLIRAKVRA